MCPDKPHTKSGRIPYWVKSLIDYNIVINSSHAGQLGTVEMIIILPIRVKYPAKGCYKYTGKEQINQKEER